MKSSAVELPIPFSTALELTLDDSSSNCWQRDSNNRNACLDHSAQSRIPR